MATLVRMRALISGSRNGKKWPKPGQTIDLPEAEAAQLIAQGIAEDPAAAETATSAEGAEQAVAPAGNKPLASIREEVKEALAAEAKAKEEAEKAEAEAKAAAAKEKPKAPAAKSKEA
ncbi:hypothetical protein FQA45_00290 [Glutamicibacter halophytocola]|uniref:Mu-like prophage FluMu N-terminal domain-containing protein n=1 Tax=Glutamicibacter halophytocola TaxID=1933880 RepID=A0ABX5Y435_9MICC|nr:hypothetical protein [Glutamicibacter halophytocola]QDY64873.1 hypothetical protein FQA45_00290 [Glutamicibacter halophytocola]